MTKSQSATATATAPVSGSPISGSPACALTLSTTPGRSIPPSGGAVAALLGLLLLALGGAVPVAARPAAAAPATSDAAPPVTVPSPDLSALDDTARRQLVQYRALVEQVGERQGAEPALGLALGELGALYFLYELPEAAAEALAGAGRLLPDDVRWPYLEGLVRADGQDGEGSVAAFRRALEVQPDHLPSLVRLGGLQLALGRPEEAAERFRQGLEISPACARCALGLAQAALARRDPAAAVAHLRHTLELQPQADSLHRILAEALRATGDAEAAARAEEAAGDTELVFYDPVVRWVRGVATGAGAHLQRGQRAFQAGETETALAELRRAVAADPENALAHQALGRTLLRAGETREGLEELSIAIQLDPSDPGGYLALGDALAAAGMRAEAAASYQRTVVLDPQNAAAHLGLARLLARSGRSEQATPLFARAAELAPEDAVIHYERGLHLASRGETEEALEALRRAVALAPERPEPRLNLAFLLEVQGQDEAARRELEPLLAGEGPPTLRARVRLALGRIAERSGDLEGAQRRYRQALELAPLPPAHLRLGSVLAAAGDYGAAAGAYGRALEAVPGHRAARVAHASALMLAGRDAEAAASLEAGLERLPEDPYLRYQLALLRAASRDDGVRDADAALELARASFGDLSNPVHAQALALAWAEGGDFESATRAQERIVASLADDDPRRPGAAARLERIRQRQPVRAPWLEDPTLLYRPTVPVPRGEGGGEGE